MRRDPLGLRVRLDHRMHPLWRQMDLEKQQFQEERAERQRLLCERQAREIEAFDEESARMGFNPLEIAEASREPLSDGDSLAGSTLSLAHSNSASSFTHTAL